jgi:hypothetical protein
MHDIDKVQEKSRLDWDSMYYVIFGRRKGDVMFQMRCRCILN